jgi:hypothetical protein
MSGGEMKRVVLWLCLVLALTVGVGGALGGNKPGNSVDSKRCQNFQDWYTREGQAFTSKDACTAYAAKKGTQLINEAALDCLDDGWKARGPSATTKITSEQECVDYAVGGGTPVAQGADVRVTYVDSAAVMCVTPWNPAYCFSKDVWVYNDGPATASRVSIDISDTEVEGAFGPNGYLVNNNFCTVTGSDEGNVTLSCTVTNVEAPGGGAFLFRFYAYNGGSHTGSATVTSSSPADPNTSNNTVSWDLTAPSVPT